MTPFQNALEVTDLPASKMRGIDVPRARDYEMEATNKFQLMGPQLILWPS